jgi:hypothetical protein
MRAEDMIIGETYALVRSPQVKVTVLPTPPEIRAERKVRVRFETGVTAGRISEVPSRRIAAPRWGGAVAKRPRPRRPGPTVFVVTHPPGVGDTVVWDEGVGLEWTVRAVDEERREATIATKIFGRPDTRTVAVDRLQVRVAAARPVVDRARRSQRRPPAVALPPGHADDAGERLRPVKPRRELDELMDDVLFTPTCLRQYDRQLGSGEADSANERLREELRRSGFIVRDELCGNEYARVRVLGRFDIVLPTRPAVDAPVYIDQLHIPARKFRPARHAAGIKRPRRAA